MQVDIDEEFCNKHVTPAAVGFKLMPLVSLISHPVWAKVRPFCLDYGPLGQLVLLYYFKKLVLGQVLQSLRLSLDLAFQSIYLNKILISKYST